MESGHIYLPHPAIAPWVESLIEECCSFPYGKYDDQVDQMTQALNRLRAMGVERPSTSYHYLPLPNVPSGSRGWMA